MLRPVLLALLGTAALPSIVLAHPSHPQRAHRRSAPSRLELDGRDPKDYGLDIDTGALTAQTFGAAGHAAAPLLNGGSVADIVKGAVGGGVGGGTGADGHVRVGSIGIKRSTPRVRVRRERVGLDADALVPAVDKGIKDAIKPVIDVNSFTDVLKGATGGKLFTGPTTIGSNTKIGRRGRWIFDAETDTYDEDLDYDVHEEGEEEDRSADEESFGDRVADYLAASTAKLHLTDSGVSGIAPAIIDSFRKMLSSPPTEGWAVDEKGEWYTVHIGVD